MLLQLASVTAPLNAAFIAAAKTTTKSSGGSTFLIILALIVLVAYFWIRPQRKRAREAQMAQRKFEVGDEIITGSGIVGRVVAMDDDRISLEIAPGTTIQVVPQAIARRVDPEVPEDESTSGSLNDAAHADPQEPAGDPSKWWPETDEKDDSDPQSGVSS